MKAFITVLKVSLAIIPELIELIQKVEIQGNGSDKKAVVLQVITESFTHFLPADLGLDPAKIQSYTGRLIDILVGFFNKVGLFQK